MNATIIFGTKKLGQTATQAVSEKYPDLAVITVEGQKGAKKSRRILMNTKAAELLGATVGEVQEFVFASVEMGEEAPHQVLIANRSTIDSEVDVLYKTSKNKVAYGEDSSEKGKAITSSHACTEIFNFLGLEDDSNVEFELNEFPSAQLEAYSLDTIGSKAKAESLETPSATNVEDEAILETNNGPVSGAELQESVKAEVARAEAENPIFEVEADAVVNPPEAVVAENEWM